MPGSLRFSECLPGRARGDEGSREGFSVDVLQRSGFARPPFLPVSARHRTCDESACASSLRSGILERWALA
jgi:hypothetical protein